MTSRSLTLLTPLALAAALAACGSRTGATVTNTTDTTVTTTNDVAAAPAGDGGMMAATPSAQQFADLAAKSDAFEIAAAKLAQANGASAAVKAFAAKMIAAHTDSTAKIKKAAAAATPAITPNPSLTSDYDTRLADLGKLKGADFDKAYVAGQIDAHNQALSLLQLYGDKGDSPPLKAAANEIIPVVKDHLVMVRGLAL
jgi:putative membrane protein